LFRVYGYLGVVSESDETGSSGWPILLLGALVFIGDL
jgi:hypothetical protein